MPLKVLLILKLLTLETKKLKISILQVRLMGLQDENAAQGLVAGTNAALAFKKKNHLF